MSKMGQLFCNMFCDCGTTDNVAGNSVAVKVYRENDSIIIPEYAKIGDAGMDLHAYRIEYDRNRYIVHTGLYFAIPYGYEMEIRPRSSLTKYRWVMVNSPGTIDSGYRGEILVIFTPLDLDMNVQEPFPYKEGDRICQILIKKCPYIYMDICKSINDLGSTDRGSGGFGSTGN